MRTDELIQFAALTRLFCNITNITNINNITNITNALLLVRSESMLLSDVTVNNATRGELQAIKHIVQQAFADFQKLRRLVATAKSN